MMKKAIIPYCFVFLIGGVVLGGYFSSNYNGFLGYGLVMWFGMMLGLCLAEL